MNTIFNDIINISGTLVIWEATYLLLSYVIKRKEETLKLFDY